MEKSRLVIQAGEVSPIVDHTFSYQKNVHPQKKLIGWAMFNLIAAIFMMGEFSCHSVQCCLGLENDIFNSCLVVLTGICILNCILDFSQAASSTMTSCAIPLSPKQKQLMGLSQDTNCHSTPMTETSSPKSLNTPSPKPYNLSAFSSSSSSPSSGVRFSQHTRSISFVDQSRGSFSSPDSPYLNKSKSPHYHRQSLAGSPGENAHFHHRRSTIFANGSLPEEEFMTEQKTLNSYLKSYFDANQTKMRAYATEVSQGQTWSPSSLYISDNSLDLSRTSYQLSTRLPTSPTHKTIHYKEDAAKVAASEYWVHSGVADDCLREWIAKLRRWLCLVILRGLVKKIDQMNKLLKYCGCIEVEIGESSLNTLKKVQINRGCQSGLAYLLPYLEVTTNQEYLVERIRSLAAGGYMSEFSWNKGGKVKGRRDWGDDLITDCELIMHLFCVYFDHHLPSDPRFPNGKAFTTQFFFKTPNKPETSTLGDKMIIYQSQLHPPHYILLSKDVTYDLPVGRHNMLCSLLLFLHHLKTKQSSMLGPVNLGMSGIDVLYVIDPLDEDSCES